MATEKKQEQVENIVQGQNVVDAETGEVKKPEKHLIVEWADSVGKNDGKTYRNYFIKGRVRGRDVKVDLSPADAGGYEVLDIVFNGMPAAEFHVVPREFTGNDGKKVFLTGYEVRSEDEDGTYSCGVRPREKSDDALLAMLLAQLAREV